jgi:hypothetical protein
MNITVFDGAYCYDINPTPGLMTNFIDEYYFPDNNVTYLLFTDSSDFVILMSLPIHSYRSQGIMHNFNNISNNLCSIVQSVAFLLRC